MTTRLEWPGRCGHCGEPISDWHDTGLHRDRWIHKSCFSTVVGEAARGGSEPPQLRSPLERSSQLELSMMISLLLFHFGLGLAVIGWILLTQDGRENSQATGAILLAVGLVTPVIGLMGIAVNIVSRRRIELVRRDLDLRGGWKPGR